MLTKNRIISVVIVLVLISLLIAGHVKNSKDNKRIYIVFRYDDYSATSNNEFTVKLLNLFRNYSESITFSVLSYTEPNNPWHDPLIREDDIVPLTLENTELLKTGLAEGSLEIALHGFSHQNHHPQEASEFSGLDFETQLSMLGEAKSHLENIINAQVTIFVPPWNEYDLNTLLAIDKLGFRIISARGRGVRSDQVDLIYLPFSCTLENLTDGIKKSRKTDKDSILLIVLMHEYEFLEFSSPDAIISFKDFSNTMKWLNRQGDVKIITLEEAVKFRNDLFYCP